MSQILRIQGEIFHVPSIARTRLYSSPIVGRPILMIVTHNGAENFLKYKIPEWHNATRDYMKLETARAACYEALKQVPMMEDGSSDPPPLTELK